MPLRLPDCLNELSQAKKERLLQGGSRDKECADCA